MFELNDSIVDALMFAMEDQEIKRLVSAQTGTVTAAADVDAQSDDFVPPPSWSSRDGYHLMEEFLKTIRSPGARRELTAALNRGRGVFRAFKEALLSFPEVDRAFHDYKSRAMRDVIRSWYDDLREAKGLSRLGEEPEDSSDLIADDLGIILGAGSSAPGKFLELVDAAAEDAVDLLPAPIISREAEITKEILGEEAWVGAWIEDGEGGLIAGAAATRQLFEGRTLCRIFFVYVLPDFRRCGMGRALLSTLCEHFRREGAEFITLDSALLPMDFSTALTTSGLSPYGCRGYFQP